MEGTAGWAEMYSASKWLNQNNKGDLAGSFPWLYSGGAELPICQVIDNSPFLPSYPYALLRKHLTYLSYQTAAFIQNRII